MGQRTGAIERARRDLADDRPWKARERLRSYLTAHPADQPARDLLGEVEWAMRNVPAAGAAWFLTERDDARAREAIAVLQHEQRGPARKLIGALGISAGLVLARSLDPWPPVVQERLRGLREATLEDLGEGRSIPHVPLIYASRRRGWRDRLRAARWAVPVLSIAGLCAATVVGVVTIALWLVGLVF